MSLCIFIVVHITTAGSDYVHTVKLHGFFGKPPQAPSHKTQSSHSGMQEGLKPSRLKCQTLFCCVSGSRPQESYAILFWEAQPARGSL